MTDYHIGDIVLSSSDNFDSELSYLWVWHADKIPPHIGISTKNNYFSLKASGKDEALEIGWVLRLIERKKIVTLAFQMKDSILLSTIKDVFANESKAESNGKTCLGPVKEILGVRSAVKIHDLLDTLYERKEIEQVIGFNVDDSFKGIPMYELEEIFDRLKKLEDV